MDIFVIAVAVFVYGENDSEETENIDDGKPKTPIMLPWIDAANLDDTEDEDKDTSEDSNTDEYPSSETTDTDRESNYYHEEDYLRNELKDLVELKNLKDKSDILRKRWKSCRKTAAKVCKEACNVSYKNACDQFKCKRKLKKAMKKECKTNCKDMFFN
ncbi:hypothetical protein HF086_007547 [Spodoptera exigua]|uniref:Uncharacterized protein n=1 Tax=Spodoptera exigua TaxID=7107 RepID=A0A922MRX0_SPOEX|nr:hypothetical protein HF086_007547 [Spodoptera exigua]